MYKCFHADVVFSKRLFFLAGGGGGGGSSVIHTELIREAELFACVESIFFPLGNEVCEWELILNRAGIACDNVNATGLSICPKHRYKPTTLYKAKVRRVNHNRF